MTDAQKRLLGKAIRGGGEFLDLYGGEHTSAAGLIGLGYAEFVYPRGVRITAKGREAALRVGLAVERREVTTAGK